MRIKEYIVAIVEGERTENQILENIQNVFFTDEQREMIILPFKTDIYELFKIL